MSKKNQLTAKERASRAMPDSMHRAEKWSGGIIYRNRKKYNRKTKHKNLTEKYVPKF